MFEPASDGVDESLGPGFAKGLVACPPSENEGLAPSRQSLKKRLGVDRWTNGIFQPLGQKK